MKKKLNPFTQNFDLVPFEVFSKATDPTVNDDVNAGYGVSDEWTNSVTKAIFKCTDNSAGAAVWFNFVNASSNDKNLVVPFTNKTGIQVNHNFGKYPSVTVTDASGEEITGEVIHNTLNQCTINFNTVVSGTIILN